MSAEVVRFIPCRRRNGGQTTDFPTIVFRLPTKPAARADTAPCEYVVPQDDET